MENHPLPRVDLNGIGILVNYHSYTTFVTIYLRSIFFSLYTSKQLRPSKQSSFSSSSKYLFAVACFSLFLDLPFNFGSNSNSL